MWLTRRRQTATPTGVQETRRETHRHVRVVSRGGRRRCPDAPSLVADSCDGRAGRVGSQLLTSAWMPAASSFVGAARWRNVAQVAQLRDQAVTDWTVS